MKSFHDGKITLHAGDCLDVLKALPENGIDAVVTDPPYGIKFMGRDWDQSANIAFRPELWAEVLRMLKPGGHMVAFSGTRTYHRMAVAIEDAGFEIRDAIMWHYGSGFPKSHDVSKGIDRHGGHSVSWFGKWLREWRERRNIKQATIAALFPSKTGGKTGCVANWELGLNLPTPEQFNLICKTFDLPFENMEAAEREIVGTNPNVLRSYVSASSNYEVNKGSSDITAPATDAARQWQGYGTALKPATEIICLARKPLSESTVAANVLRWGTGALNIDGCRIPTNEKWDANELPNARDGVTWGGDKQTSASHDLGRWPANLCHDGSPEVLAGFPERTTTERNPSHVKARENNVYGKKFFDSSSSYNGNTYGETGSAARFFYTAKADADDRLGSKHPTVKPVDLMQWLVKLVCPKGATVLDPFAGTGTTGAASFIEGRRCVLIEREAEYLADIEKRMGMLLSGSEERSWKLAKPEPLEGLPLFALPEPAE